MKIHQFSADSPSASAFVQSKADEHFHNEFHLNTFWDIMQGTFLDTVVQKYRNQNEDRALIERVERSSFADTILVCDRGYEAYNNIAHIQQANRNDVMRIKEQGAFGIADGLELPDEDEFDVYTKLSLTRKSSLALKSLAKRNKNKYKCISSHVHFDYLPPSKRKEPAVFFILKFRIFKNSNPG